MVVRSPVQSAKGSEQQDLAVCLSSARLYALVFFTCMLFIPAYMCLAAQVVRAPVQCSEG